METKEKKNKNVVLIYVGIALFLGFIILSSQSAQAQTPTPEQNKTKALKLLGEHSKILQTLQFINIPFFINRIKPLYAKLGFEIYYENGNLYLK